MRQDRKSIVGLLFFVIVLMAITMIGSHRMQTKLTAGEAEIRVLQQAIEQEHTRTEEIAAMQEYMNSDAYKEQVAKDKLGLIRDGEIIFKEADKD